MKFLESCNHKTGGFSEHKHSLKIFKRKINMSCTEKLGSGEREMWDLEDLLSKLNPIAKEFVSPSLTSPVATVYPGFATPMPLPLAVYWYYPTNTGFTVLSPVEHKGIVGFPSPNDSHAGHDSRVTTLHHIYGLTLFLMSTADG
jgi:hypothetical protein